MLFISFFYYVFNGGFDIQNLYKYDYSKIFINLFILLLWTNEQLNF